MYSVNGHGNFLLLDVFTYYSQYSLLNLPCVQEYVSINASYNPALYGWLERRGLANKKNFAGCVTKKYENVGK